MPSNVCVPFFKPGQDITGYLTANLGGKRFVVAAAGGRGGQPYIGLPATSGVAVMGVLGHDGVTGEYVHVNVAGVVPVVAGASVAAGQEVQTDNAGAAIPLAAGRPAGYALTAASAGNAVAVKLYG